MSRRVVVTGLGVPETPGPAFENDPDLLKQILLNLVRNAAEAAKSEVRVNAIAEGKTIVIGVEDLFCEMIARNIHMTVKAVLTNVK